MNNRWQFHHIGIPVFDLDKSLENLKAMGEATFEPEALIDSNKATAYLVNGEKPDCAILTRVAMGRVGSLAVELLQPLEGNTVHRQLLESVGEGIGHIAYTVEDLDAEVAALEEKGFSVMLSITPFGQQQRKIVYIDTRSHFNHLITELIQA